MTDKPEFGWYTQHEINMIRFKAVCWGVAVGLFLGFAMWGFHG